MAVGVHSKLSVVFNLDGGGSGALSERFASSCLHPYGVHPVLLMTT